MAIDATVPAPTFATWRALGGQLDRLRGAAIRSRRRLVLRGTATRAAPSGLRPREEAMLVLLDPVLLSEQKAPHLVGDLVGLVVQALLRRAQSSDEILNGEILQITKHLN